ncbi:hypothetical protein GCM10023192_56860 [Amycolatopsis samaneae]
MPEPGRTNIITIASELSPIGAYISTELRPPSACSGTAGGSCNSISPSGGRGPVRRDLLLNNIVPTALSFCRRVSP